MRCHHIHVDDLGKVFIPGCDSAAALGAHACVCYMPRIKPNPNTLESQILDLEKENRELHRIIRNLTKRKS